MERRLNALEALVRKVISSNGVVSSGTTGGPTTVGVLQDHDHTGTSAGGALTGTKHDSYDEHVAVSDPSSPAAGTARFYSKLSGGIAKLFYKQSDGTVVGPLAAGGAGSLATDALWDAAGDLVVGTGADTAAILSKPSPTELANTTPSAFTNWASQTGNARKTLMFDSGTGAIEWDYLNSIDILTPAQVLTFTCTPAGGASSLGLVASSGTDVPAFVMTYQGTPTNADIDIQSETYAGSPEVSGSDYTVDAPLFTSLTGPAINRGTAVGETVTFRLTATVDGQTKTKDVTVTYINYRYYGISSNAAIDTDGEIDTFASTQTNSLVNARAVTFTVAPGSGEYIYYILRTALGTPVFTVGGFEGGFSKVGAAVTHTNSRSFSETFDVWRSDNPNLGSTTVVVT